MWEVIVAAVVAGFVSTAITLWLRRADRPKADWIFARLTLQASASFRTYLMTERGGKQPDFLITATNAGDGAAYQLEVAGIECEATIFVTDTEDKRGWRIPAQLAKIEPGEEIGILIWFHPVYEKDTVGVRLRWLRPPVRHGRYDERELLLASPEPQPRLGQRVASWFRSLRASAKRRWARLTRRKEQL